MATFIIASIIFALIGFIIYYKVKAYRNGESSCGGGCSGCSSAKGCPMHTHNKGMN